ncbi:succinate dehydrogenase, cytochrome b556 subunit [Marichromatium bheemlicum]|uniref:Succinate dehydrogenase cytochrome b556 subunit n=1 Tax=Marichromatium bheemlicum TaxID=365339 RepID=A0ABX1I8W1_9GAMM|nr:succinate dehydrogenase, cytochrome b556 subunit [Marichromatium bheemlicum]NKN33708.1 succinate dehydrogenase, cytochrome b556 subunit [Marichromatium bheemlicum]
MHITRPVFLDLWRIKLPIPAFVSILHRISGVLMILAIPVAAFLFDRALSGPEGFAFVAALFDTWFVKVALGLMIWSLLHHLVAGIRFLVLDLGVGLDRPVARATAWTALLAALAALAAVIALGGTFR